MNIAEMVEVAVGEIASDSNATLIDFLIPVSRSVNVTCSDEYEDGVYIKLSRINSAIIWRCSSKCHESH